jgi:hypothetical protein
VKKWYKDDDGLIDEMGGKRWETMHQSHLYTYSSCLCGRLDAVV